MKNSTEIYLDKIHEEIVSIEKDINKNPGVEFLYSSLKYYFSNKGKMLRPGFMITVNEDLGGDFDQIKNFGIALELIHNYSLIHDDLPAMDNDDYRRGQFTIHKKYDEATAILLGDFLLTKAFEYASLPIESIDNGYSILKCINVLSKNANDFGMLGGQIMDMNPKKLSESSNILKMYEYKTSALFQSAFIIPGIINGLDDLNVEKLRKIGKYFGILFQILDDISDREEDEKIGKITILNFLNENEIQDIIQKFKEKINEDINSLKLKKTKEMMEEFYEKI